MANFLSPLEAPFPADVEPVLSRYPQTDGYILALFRTFANSTRFLTDHGVVNFLDRNSPLPLREREIVINRTCANLDCEYEWGVHIAIFAQAAGFTKDQIAAFRQMDSQTDCWTKKDAILIEVVDQLCRTSTLTEEFRLAFSETWTKEQQLEIMGIVGNYHTISYVANVARLENEPFGVTFAEILNPEP